MTAIATDVIGTWSVRPAECVCPSSITLMHCQSR